MSHVLVSSQDGVTRIQLNRPEKKNALSLAMYTAIAEALTKTENDPAARVSFITGVDRSFTSGNDIMDFLQNPPTDESSPVAVFLRALVEAKKPLVAAVNGLAIGVGTTMLPHCDLVYAAESAVFQMPFVNLGVCPEAGSSYLLPRMMGLQKAAELILLSEKFDARKAESLGLVTKVLPDAELEAYAWAKAKTLAEQPPAALRTAKELLKRASNGPLQEAMQVEMEKFRPMLGGPEATEAMTAFMEKRKPDFSQFS
jgi:enoyl-CoA hydratase/carnithine racemase